MLSASVPWRFGFKWRLSRGTSDHSTAKAICHWWIFLAFQAHELKKPRVSQALMAEFMQIRDGGI